MIEYEWSIGSWGSCNANCGSGMRYRDVECIRKDTLQTVFDNNCKGTTKPNASDTCMDYSPYSWETDPWTECSSSCGTGIRTRDVYCIQCDGNRVADYNCTSSRPVGNESCSGTDCPVCDNDHLHLCKQSDCTAASGYWYNNVCNQYPKPVTCDFEHLDLCNQNNCSVIGGYWYNNKCNTYPKPDQCDSIHLFLCDNPSNCQQAGGYWYNSQCNSTPEPVECDFNHLNLCSNFTMCQNVGGFWYENACNESAQKSTYHEYFEETGDHYGIPFNLLKAIAYVETGWNQSVFSGNAWGIMQLKEDDLIIIARYLKNDYSQDYDHLTVDDIISLMKEDSNNGARANIRGAACKLKNDADENSELIYDNEPRHALEVWWFVVAAYNGGGCDHSIFTSNYPFRVFNCFIDGIYTKDAEVLVPKIPITLPPNITFRLANNDELSNGEVNNSDHELVPRTPPGFIRNTLAFDACKDIGYLHDNEGTTINQSNCQPDHFTLSFPIKGFTSSDAPINSVFDYSQPGYFDATRYYRDNFVVDYMGEYGDKSNGAFSDGYKNKNGDIFSVNGNYKAAGFGAEYLFYDGHPAIDYKAGYGEKLYATADGYFNITHEPNEDSLSISRAYIDHGNYRTYYVHCQKFTPKNDEYVIAGEEIGESGNEGSTGPHLHLEIQKRIGNKWYFVDPYGWQADKDKNWTEAANANLWAGGSGGTVSNKPQNFTVELMNNNVTLTWQPPLGGEPEEYNIYRDHEKIASINGSTISYIDSELIPDGVYKYYIRSIYNGVESSTSNPGRIILSDQEEMITKRLELKQGWNWISFSIKTDDNSSLNSILSSINNYAIKIVSQKGYAEYYSGWYGPLQTIDPEKMYMLKVSQDCDLALEGYPLNPKDINYSLNENWNWIGVLNDSILDIQTALSVLDGKGIKIVGQEGYAEYENGWVHFPKLNQIQAI